MSIPVQGRQGTVTEKVKKLLPYIAMLGIAQPSLKAILGAARPSLKAILGAASPSLKTIFRTPVKAKTAFPFKARIIAPYSANVRGVEVGKAGTHVLFSNGAIYKYSAEMTPKILATLGRPYAAKTTGKNVFKAWHRGVPSVGGSFWKMIAQPSQRQAGTYQKVPVGPPGIMRQKMHDEAFKGADKILKEGKNGIRNTK